MLMFPRPCCPLSGQAGFGQNVVDGSMSSALLAV